MRHAGRRCSALRAKAFLTYLVVASIVLKAVNIPAASASNVLGVALPYAKSHYSMIKKIGEDLVSRGHNVTLLVADIDLDIAEAAAGLGMGSIVYQTPWSAPPQLQQLKDTIQYAAELTVLQGINIRLGTAAEACETLLTDDGALHAVTELKPDLLLADSIFACSSLLADKLDLQRVDVSPTGLRYPYHADIWRQQNPIMLIPQYGSQLSLKMGPQSVLWNLGVLLWARHVVYRPHFRALDRLRVAHGITPSSTLRSYRSATPLALINDDFAFLPSRPLTPNIKVVGPIQPTPAHALPPELESFFNGAGPAGVVYVSLGTYDGLGHGELLSAMASALGSLPCRVLWKLGPSEFESMGNFTGRVPHLASNIKTIPFAPQNDVLGHPATRAFLSHLGLNSLYEAAYHAVPIVGIPLASDQPDNMKVAQHHGFGLEVPRPTRSWGGTVPLPTHAAIRQTILSVLDDPSFQAAAARISHRLHGHRRTPLQNAADWVEHVLKTHGDTYLAMPYHRSRLCHIMDYFLPELAAALLLAITYSLATLLLRLTAIGLTYFGLPFPVPRTLLQWFLGRGMTVGGAARGSNEVASLGNEGGTVWASVTADGSVMRASIGAVGGTTRAWLHSLGPARTNTNSTSEPTLASSKIGSSDMQDLGEGSQVGDNVCVF